MPLTGYLVVNTLWIDPLKVDKKLSTIYKGKRLSGCMSVSATSTRIMRMLAGI
jgi:hypothetical protein